MSPGLRKTADLYSLEQLMHQSCDKSSTDLTDAPDGFSGDRTIDAFISYRRINGSQLARSVYVLLYHENGNPKSVSR